MTRVLVTGATGNVGREVVAALRRRGTAVRALVRDPDRAARLLGDDVDLAVGDFTESGSLRRAMRGVDAMFLTSADGPAKVAHETAVIDAAAASWVPRIVKLSSIGAAVGDPLQFSDWHGRIEDHLAASGIPATVLRCNFFMTNLFMDADTVRRTGQLFAPADDAKIAMIDSRDIGETAAVVLTEPGHEGLRYLLTGPEAITYADVAARLSAATGRAVEFVDVPDEAARSALLGAGVPGWLVDNLVTLFGQLRTGLCEEVTDAVPRLTGRPPHPFRHFAERHAAMFRP